MASFVLRFGETRGERSCVVLGEQEVVDELAHARGLASDDGKQATTLDPEIARTFFLDRRHEPEDRTDGRAQIVRDRVAETLEAGMLVRGMEASRQRFGGSASGDALERIAEFGPGGYDD